MVLITGTGNETKSDEIKVEIFGYPLKEDEFGILKREKFLSYNQIACSAPACNISLRSYIEGQMELQNQNQNPKTIIIMSWSDITQKPILEYFTCLTLFSFNNYVFIEDNGTIF